MRHPACKGLYLFTLIGRYANHYFTLLRFTLYAYDFRQINGISNFNVMDIELDYPTDYILEVNLEYPQHLH